MKIFSTRDYGQSLIFDPDLPYFEDLSIYSKTTEPIVAKCHIKPPEVEGTQFCSNRPGHMINTAVMPIYGKNIETSSSTDSIDR